MKRVLILGSGVYQVPLIKKAKNMGLYTIVTSIRGKYPGFLYADKCYYENTTDKEVILQIAQKENVDAILTSGTDVAVSTIGYVCRRLGLNGVSEKSATLVTNKALMKEAFRNYQVCTPEYAIAHSAEDAKMAALKLGYPVMFKCVNSSGSRGVIKVKDSCEIDRAYEYASSVTEKKYIVIEKFVDGCEIGLDGFIINEDKMFFVPHDKIVYSNGMTNVPIGHVFPYTCDDTLHQKLLEQAEKAIRALNLKNCFFNMDILISADKVYIIEVGARTGATCIPELISLHYNIDYYQMMLDAALGHSVSIPTKPFQASAGCILYSEKDGVVRKIDYSSAEGGIIAFDIQVGEYVSKFQTGNHRIGHMLATGDTAELALEKLETMKKHIVLQIF